jgi:hypothetical protein
MKLRHVGTVGTIIGLGFLGYLTAICVFYLLPPSDPAVGQTAPYGHDYPVRLVGDESGAEVLQECWLRAPGMLTFHTVYERAGRWPHLRWRNDLIVATGEQYAPVIAGLPSNSRNCPPTAVVLLPRWIFLAGQSEAEEREKDRTQAEALWQEVAQNGGTP